MQQNCSAASSHMAAHTPYRMAVSVKQRGRSTESWEQWPGLGTWPWGRREEKAEEEEEEEEETLLSALVGQA